MAQHAQLLTFPDELLLSIFEVVEDDRPAGDGFAKRDRNPESVRTLQNLRLTCRRFHEIASTLLIPTIRVGFTRSSIKRFEEVCSHQLISQGVRVVQVELDLFDPLRVINFESFQSHMAGVIKDVLLKKWRSHELEPRSTWGKTLCCEPKLRRARIVFATMSFLEVPSGVGFKLPQEYIEQARMDMNKAWKVYCSSVRFQNRLLKPAAMGDDNGISVFAQRLALDMAKISGRRPRTIELLGSSRRTVPPLDRVGGLSQKGTDWSRSDFEIFYEPFLRPENSHNCNLGHCQVYKALSHIPQALQAENVRIVEGISVDLPHMPVDTDGDSIEMLFEALRFLKLKSFNLRTTSPNLYRRDQAYLTTCLAGFESLSRYMPALARRVTAAAAIGITTSANNKDARDWREDDDDGISDPNARINANLRCVRINGGLFQLKDLGELLQSFPRRGLDEFSICHARLRRDDDDVPGHPQELERFVVGTRSWEKALDLLREDLVLRRPGGFRLRRVCTRLSQYYTDMAADEFAGIWGEAPLRRDEERKQMRELVEMGLVPGLPSPAEEYVMRFRDVNPIRARRGVEEEQMRAAAEERKELFRIAPFFGVSSLADV